MLTKDQVFAFLFTWLKTESGLTVIKVPQPVANGRKAPRPARPYASIRFLNPSQRLGNSIDQQSVTGDKKVATEGMRSATASINIFGDDAIDLLARVRDSLDRPDVQMNFAIAGIAHLSESIIDDLTELEETVYEERGHFDLTVAFVAGSEVDVSTIETVHATGSFGAQEADLDVSSN